MALTLKYKNSERDGKIRSRYQDFRALSAQCKSSRMGASINEFPVTKSGIIWAKQANRKPIIMIVLDYKPIEQNRNQ